MLREKVRVARRGDPFARRGMPSHVKGYKRLEWIRFPHVWLVE